MWLALEGGGAISSEHVWAFLPRQHDGRGAFWVYAIPVGDWDAGLTLDLGPFETREQCAGVIRLLLDELDSGEFEVFEGKVRDRLEAWS